MLEAELRKHGLEVASRDELFRGRTFIAHVRFIGGKRKTLLGLAYASLDDWRQNEIDAAIAAAKKELKPRLPKNPPAQLGKVARNS